MNFKLFLETSVISQLEKRLEVKYPAIEQLDVHENEYKIHISSIKIKEGERNKGYGTKIIEEIQKYAQAVNKPIVLMPFPERGKKAKLEQFYRNLGFIPNRGRRKNYMLSNPFGPTWIWYPVKR